MSLVETGMLKVNGFFHCFAINLHVRFAFFYIGFAACSRRAIVLYVFRIFFCKFAISGQNLWESLKNTKNPRKFAKKNANNLQKKNKRTRLKLEKNNICSAFCLQIVCIFCKFPSVFCISPAFPEVLPGNCKFAKKNAKKCKKKMSFQDMLQIQREKNAEKIQIKNAK